MPVAVLGKLLVRCGSIPNEKYTALLDNFFLVSYGPLPLG